jgi:AraC-like DNA-binding protein
VTATTESHRDSVSGLEAILGSMDRGCRFRLHGATNLVVPSRWGFTDRVNTDYHLLLVRSGKGTYTIEGRNVPLQAGRIVFLSHGIRHSAKPDRRNLPGIIPIRFGLVSGDPPQLVSDAVTPFHATGIVPNLGKYLCLFEALYECWAHRSRISPGTRAHLLLATVLCEMLHDLRTAAPAAEADLRMERARRHLEFHATSAFSARALADVVGLSPKYVCRQFKKAFGVTPKSYVARVRLERARALLTTAGFSVKQVAYDMGYSDPAAFSRAYKQRYGVSPSNLDDGTGR